MSKRYIRVSLDEETYRQLEFVGNQTGVDVNKAARMGVDFLLLFLRNSAMKAYFDDKTAFDKKAAETFEKLYKIPIEQVKDQSQSNNK